MPAIVERLRTFHVERRLPDAFAFVRDLMAHIRRARLEGIEERARLAEAHRKRLAERAAKRAKKAEWDRIGATCLAIHILTTTSTTAREPGKGWN